MFRWFIPTLVAVAVGLLVLLGSLLPIPLLTSVREDLLRGATVLAAFAMVLAYGNILRVHTERLFTKQTKNRVASAVLLVSALVSLVLVLVQGPEGPLGQAIVEAILIPGQSALLALTAVTLVLAGMRLFRTRRHLNSVIFLVVVLLMLWNAVPLIYPRILADAMQFVDAIATGGIRGLLLGVALGTIVTGLRIILGIDRPHSGG